jgi:hypothetical protein
MEKRETLKRKKGQKAEKYTGNVGKWRKFNEILDKGRGIKDEGETFGHGGRTMAESEKNWEIEKNYGKKRNIEKEKKIEHRKNTGNVGKWRKKFKELMGVEILDNGRGTRMREKHLAMEEESRQREEEPWQREEEPWRREEGP